MSTTSKCLRRTALPIQLQNWLIYCMSLTYGNIFYCVASHGMAVLINGEKELCDLCSQSGMKNISSGLVSHSLTQCLEQAKLNINNVSWKQLKLSYWHIIYLYYKIILRELPSAAEWFTDEFKLYFKDMPIMASAQQEIKGNQENTQIKGKHYFKGGTNWDSCSPC